MKLRVTTHSGDEDIVDVESYDPQALVNELNDNAVQSIILGDHIYARIDIKGVRPYEEPSEEVIEEGGGNGPDEPQDPEETEVQE